ncbi:helix-turn-helix domain-containing protein [Jongsikchunia kroppenstedtii]|uniref:helix-turn-helix domain-containing protein n=1 Tax=Jongsikchunia kroppenstedtii TaxID=1121721 RepID=UPI0003667BB6|nr:helix-turn-helix transcriptional regulator [Jongsikchunia kroppenstedtii]
MKTTTETLGQVVGRNVRRLRLEQDATLEDVGRAVRSLGFNWSTSRVNAIERGAREPKYATILVLAVALSCTPRDLVSSVPSPQGRKDTGNLVDLGGVLIHRLELMQMFPEVTPALVPDPDKALSDQQWAERQGFDDPESLLAEVYSSMDWAAKSRRPKLSQLRSIAERSGLVEERTARMLNLRPVVLAAWSWAMWGHTLGAERDRRCAESSDVELWPADVTAELRAELRARTED